MMASMKPLAKLAASAEVGRPVPVSSRVDLRAGLHRIARIVITREAIDNGRCYQIPSSRGRLEPYHLTIRVLSTYLGVVPGPLYGRIAPEAAAGAESRPLHSRVPAASLGGN